MKSLHPSTIFNLPKKVSLPPRQCNCLSSGNEERSAETLRLKLHQQRPVPSRTAHTHTHTLTGFISKDQRHHKHTQTARIDRLHQQRPVSSYCILRMHEQKTGEEEGRGRRKKGGERITIQQRQCRWLDGSKKEKREWEKNEAKGTERGGRER